MSARMVTNLSFTHHHWYKRKTNTSSVSPELLQGFARSLALVANWRNITLLSINMKANWRASFLKSCEQANQCNNSGETEEVQSLEQAYLEFDSTKSRTLFFGEKR